MKNGIIIYWSDSQEILEFDCNNFESIKAIKSSSEWWCQQRPKTDPLHQLKSEPLYFISLG